ncbi:MAG: FAD-binding protein [Anaerolineales bacterium]|nr:FAD-binding protein [Anaerolineales bacterium]MDW8226700.1 FAD-linked oxidase C-terminal domain-containing protein [Anaerolineales bacterium]
MSDTPTLSEFFSRLRRSISGELRIDKISRVLYSSDASIYQVEPYGVLLPRSVEDIQAAIELAAQFGVPILPRGGGTSMAGQTVNRALVIDTTRYLHRILEVNPEEKWVRAEAGVFLSSLNAYVQPYGLKFGPDPASGTRAALGGVVGNNSSGSHSILYGMTADHILAVQAILSDGSLVEFSAKSEAELEQLQARNDFEGKIYRCMLALVRNPHNLHIIRQSTPVHWRRCGGYNLDRLTDGQGFSFRWPFDPRFNLARLICGSEGTLAFITEVKLNLVKAPKMTALAILHFDDLRASLDSVPLLLEANPSAIEMLDSHTMSLVENAPVYASQMHTFIQGHPNNVLIVEFYGDSLAELEAKLKSFNRHLEKHRIRTGAVVQLTDPAAIETVWKVRTAGFGFLMGMRGDVKPLAIADDTAVPPEHLADYILEFEKYCTLDLNHPISYFAHASAGCLHVHNFLNAKLGSDVEKFPKIIAKAGLLAKQYGGVLSSEHGDGRLRSWFNQEFFGEDMYALFKQVKGIFDPHNLFNPGNIVDAPSMTEHLRYGPTYRSIPIRPMLDFGAEGFDRAVEMCNGTALCRQLTGHMCPTYKAGRDEQLSTRGRANALRAAISGKVDLDDPALYTTLDWCISCKACKTECPSSVDMAKLKAEYLHQYYQKHPIPLRSRFFAYFGELSHLAGGWRAPLTNWMLRSKPLRFVLNRMLHLASKRLFPTFARQTFDAFYRRQKRLRRNQQVVLLVDVARNYNYPEVARAAYYVLEACGYEVIVPPIHDIGRPAFSKGDLPLARKKAQQALDFLAPYATQGLLIITLEPSDLSMLIDDNLSLFPNDTRARLVAEHSLSLEEFLWREMKSGRLSGKFKPQQGKLLLHGHCHQKALIGVQYSQELLSFLGYQVEEAGSACCGMAGSFGYEAEHYDLSLKMGELTLFPKVRAQDRATLIVAAGISCHEQIAHGTGRKALHPAEVLYQALV